MLKRSVFLLALMLVLSACVEVLSIPNLSLNSDESMMAFLLESEEGESMTLNILNLGTGTSSQIGNPGSMIGAFAWHPSEARLAFAQVEAENKSSIQIAELEGEASTILVLPDNAWVNQMAFSPDGLWLALSVSLVPIGTDMRHLLDFTEDVNPSEIQVLLLNPETGENFEIASAEVGDSPSLDWNGNGNLLAYAFDGRVYVYELSEEKSSQITWAEFLSLRSPAWLDDDSLVMLSAPDPDGEGSSNTEIVLHHLDSGERQSWLVGGGSAVPSPSPNGQYIAYLEGQASSDPELSNQGYASANVTVMLLDVEAGTMEPLFVGISLDRPVWSSDSRRMYVSNGNAFSMSVENERQIYAVDVTTGSSELVYEGAIGTSSLLGWFPPQEEN